MYKKAGVLEGLYNDRSKGVLDITPVISQRY